MKKPDRSTYTALDFAGWQAASTLEITPKFQRRGVWNTAAQSFFIDTLMLGMPVPPLYLRVVQGPKKDKVVREVVDGQQRITAVLKYMADEFSLSKGIDSPAKGKKFSQLSQEQQDQITQYALICEVFHGISDAEVLSIFQRLNTYSVKLNDQELRNGQYFGQFKSLVYELAYQNIEFWRNNRIFSERDIARMAEAEASSEMLIALLAGMQDKKKSISSFYEKHDEVFPDRDKTRIKFERVIDAINASVKDELAETEFRRAPLFYSLFVSVAHRLYGVPGFAPVTPRKTMTAAERASLRIAVVKLSEIVGAARDDPNDVPNKYQTFVAACLRQTDNLRPRQVRAATLYATAFG